MPLDGGWVQEGKFHCFGGKIGEGVAFAGMGGGDAVTDIGDEVDRGQDTEAASFPAGVFPLNIPGVDPAGVDILHHFSMNMGGGRRDEIAGEIRCLCGGPITHVDIVLFPGPSPGGPAPDVGDC